MMTIGDVLGVAGLLFAVGICSWAIMMATALLFPSRCRTAKDAIEATPRQTLIKGFLITVVVGIVGIAFLSSPFGPLKLLGTTILTGLLAVAAVGAGGLAQLLGSRLKAMQNDMSEYGLVCRGAGIVFLCAIAPFIGWFLIGPVILATAVGAGARALVGRNVPVMSDLS